MNKRIWLIPIHMLSGTGGAAIFDRFIKLRIIETLKELGVTTGNSIVYSNNFRSIYHRANDGNGNVAWFSRTMNECGFMVHDIHFSKMATAVNEWMEVQRPMLSSQKVLSMSLGTNLSSLILSSEAIRVYLDDKTMIPNIIIPVEYNFLEIMSTWENNCPLASGMKNLPQMGWIAEIETDKFGEKTQNELSYAVRNPSLHSFLNLFAGFHFKITASQNLPKGKMELPSWLTTRYSNGSDMFWYNPLIWQLIHIPDIVLHHDERKDIWKKLRAKKGYVHGKVFPEPVPVGVPS